MQTIGHNRGGSGGLQFGVGADVGGAGTSSLASLCPFSLSCCIQKKVQFSTVLKVVQLMCWRPWTAPLFKGSESMAGVQDPAWWSPVQGLWAWASPAEVTRMGYRVLGVRFGLGGDGGVVQSQTLLRCVQQKDTKKWVWVMRREILMG